MSRWYELFWSGEKLKSPLALDTETEAIDPNKKDSFPRFVLGTASDGERTCVIGPHQVVDFLLLHKDCEIVGFNFAYDFWVLLDETKRQGKFHTASQVLWEAANENHIHDMMLLDQLIWLATGKGEGTEEGKFFRRDMDKVAKEYLEKEISKKGNEYRLRFGELLNISPAAWEKEVDSGFFEYACQDALTTWELYTVMRPYAESLQKRFGGVAYPDAQKRFGVLTEAIQVKASIALAKITKNGMRVDRERARTLESATRKEFDEFIPYLAQNFPDVLKAYKRKEGYKISKKTGVPQMNAKELQRLFTEWSPSFGLDGPILSKGKERRVSVSTKDWGIFKNKSEFINRWVNAKALSMRLGFFDMLKEEYLHPTYNTMVRTGRVSCTKPNAQQCFDGETEVLTNAGWVRFSDVSKRSDLDSLLVAQWHDGIISFVKPERWVEQVREEPFLRYTNEHIDLCVTEDHLCLLQHRKTGQFKTVLGKDYPEDHRQLHGGLYLGCHEEEFLSDEELILLIATQADGSWSFGSRIDFSFSKERKIDRLKALLDSLGVKYSCKPRPIPNNPNHKRSTRIVVSPCELTDKIYSYLGKNKRFGSYLLRLPRRQLDLFCEELFFWDGTWKTKTQYSSVEKENADWAQIALILSNQRANVWEYDGSKWGGKRISHQIARTTRNYSLTTNIERGTLINHDGKSYCVTVPSGYIVVRRKGKTHVTGNCPKKGDFRSCFIASDGNFLLTSDYGAIELCTLAAICQKRFGFSVLGDTIRSGKDPHLYTAALILKKDYEDLKVELKKEKELEKPGGPVSDARQAAKACFHPDVELLTPVGWKKISDVTTDDLVAQYWPGEGEVEFVHPTHKVVLQDKPLLEVETRHSYLRVTPDHRMYGLDWAEKPMVCFPCDYKRRTRKTVHAGIKAEGGVQDEWNIRRAVCIQADGSRLESGLGFTFGFKKEKKIERFKNLFDQHIVWEKKDPSGITRFRVNNLPEWGKYLTDEKTFRTDKLLDLDETSRKAFLDELYFWDGTHKTSDRAFSVTTIRKEVADSIQAVASVTGRRTVVNTWIPNLSDKPAYEISIVTCSDARPSKMNVSETDYVGEVHCVSVPSTLLITRDSLRVQVSGNCNFGIPGGLGKDKLVEYAKATYGVTMSVKQAEEFRSKIINEVYPELDLYLQSSDLKNLADNLSLPEEALYEYVFENYGDVGMFLHCMGRVIGHDEKKNGPLLKKDGTEFSPSFREKLWHLAEELLEMSFVPAAEKKDLRPNIKDRKGEWKLWKAFFGGIAVTLTGRVRRGVKFTEQMNTQFQGLAADGMKLAIFEMVKRGKRLVATVHDEAVNDVRKEIAEKEREEIGEIMKQCMGEVLDFAVPISVEHKLAECWSK